ncbi:hypothetical protein HZA73_12055, partial [candidate division TA06 bacterium]|nr:hypothetical protein [candidate division TA06 bacterium]
SAIQPGDEEIGIVFIDCDQWGNVINRIYCGWGVDPAVENGNWSAQQAAPAYMWASSGVNFKDVSKEIQNTMMRTLYVSALYGDADARENVAAYRCAKIEMTEGNNYKIGTDGNCITVGKNIDINTLIAGTLHEGFHLRDYISGNNEYHDTEWVENVLTGEYEPSKIYDNPARALMPNIMNNINRAVQFNLSSLLKQFYEYLKP